ncbi:MAG TPA: VOC family protein [Marinagarivorans sp.]
MEISGVRIFVKDIAEVKKFYADKMGLTVESAGPGFVIFDTGPARLIVESVSESDLDAHAGLIGRFTGISFTVKNIEAEYKKLSSLGVEFSGEPEQQYWGGWLATFVDPAGNGLQLVQQPV